MQENIWGDENSERMLKQGGVVIMPTDTLYGMLGQALNESTVNRIYAIRKRDPRKPCIILIGDINELEKFSVVLSEKQKQAIGKYWPGPVSIVLDCSEEKLFYLHRGTRTLAFRLPAPQAFRDFLLKTGPLVAPSANTETFPPSDNVHDAEKYFGDQVDLYVDGGELSGKASKIIKLRKDGTADIIRQ